MVDELIRQVSIISIDRGLLLIRIREEFKTNLEAYNQLLEDNLMCGTRKIVIVSYNCIVIILILC